MAKEYEGTEWISDGGERGMEEEGGGSRESRRRKRPPMQYADLMREQKERALRPAARLT